jgi:beta-lactamase class A
VFITALKSLWARPWTTSTVVFISLAIGISIGGLAFRDSENISASSNCAVDLGFVKPEQDCESFNNTVDKMQSLQDDLRRQVNGYLSSNRAGRISVFVRDLSSQRFANVNETEEFYMASLLKVPLAVAYYRLAELTPDLLTQKVTYTGKPDLYSLQVVQPPKKLVVGDTYTVKDLIYRALAYSDNTSAQILSDNYVSYDYLQRILFTLGLQPKAKDQTENLVTARSYAGIFRTLYNSAFLSREYSNEILKTLSESTFTDGATANLPKGVTVSHKFGERSVVGTAGTVTTRQLHDCGVAYAKDGTEAYSFCIMTEGANMDDLKSIIQNVSGTIYKGIVE